MRVRVGVRVGVGDHLRQADGAVLVVSTRDGAVGAHTERCGRLEWYLLGKLSLDALKVLGDARHPAAYLGEGEGEA